MRGSRLRALGAFLLGGVLAVGCSGGKPGEPASAEVLEQLQESYYIQHGESDFVAYAFTDPQCPACGQLHERVEGGLTPSVEWRWVPVGFLGRQSQEQAAEKLEQAHDVDGSEAVQANMELARRLGVQSVPTIFYQDLEGQARTFVGGKKQALKALEEMASQ